MTGVLSEDGVLTNSYTYDAYGNLTSGTPDARNYYGYNGESTNALTGLQYLRARYYDTENGTFTSEDDYRGTLTDPLTRNRYIYTTNNPMNYEDPSGNKLIDKIKKASNAVGKTITKAWKTVTTAFANQTKGLASAAQRSYSYTKNVQTTQSGGSSGSNKGSTSSGGGSGTNSTSGRSSSGGSSSIKSSQSSQKKGNGIFSGLGSKLKQKVQQVKAKAQKVLCSTQERISTQLSNVNWKNVKKVAIGVGIVAALGVATVLTGGAAGAIVAGAFMGAAIGSTSGAIFGGVTSKISGGSFADGAADGFMWGAIGGAVSGGFAAGIGGAAASTVTSTVSSNVANSTSRTVLTTTAKFVSQNLVDGTMDTINDAAHGKEFTTQRLLKNVGESMLFSVGTDALGNAAKNVTKAVDVPIPESAKNYTSVVESNKPYANSRPSFRKGVVEQVWENAKDADGYVRDPNTGKIINWNLGESRVGVWDMGHIQSQKYSVVHERYMNGTITKKQFLDWYNDPANYRPETPHNNRSHAFE